MELIKYLNDHFFTMQELLDISKTEEHDFLKYQKAGVMPKCSYTLRLDLEVDSFFGLYSAEQEIEYYAKGYSSWLSTIQSLDSMETAFPVFARRYKAAIEDLKSRGHFSNNVKINSELSNHINQEWDYFLDGTYGLCTKSGLPEDIAAKEFSIIEISELLEFDDLNPAQLDRLIRAVTLLDVSSSLFAPHERLHSSRHRLVDEVRRKYKLQR